MSLYRIEYDFGYPLSASLVVMATNEEQAKKLAKEHLKQKGEWPYSDEHETKVHKMEMKPQVLSMKVWD